MSPPRFNLFQALPELLGQRSRDKLPGATAAIESAQGRDSQGPASGHPASAFAEASFGDTQFNEDFEDTRLYVPWSRMAELQGRPHDRAAGIRAVVRQLALDPALAQLGEVPLQLAAGYMDFVEADAGQVLLREGEQGDFMILLLQGEVVEQRQTATGPALRLGVARAGALLGELSLVDAGPRPASCVASTPVLLAALAQPALERLLDDDPRLAAALQAWLARRLALRLRDVSRQLHLLLNRAAASPAAP